MKPEIADKLTHLTNAFYQQQAASFSATRQAPWRGWDRCLAAWSIAESGRLDAPVPVLDVGCGNLRFERYLEQEHAAVPWSFYAVDNCRPLVEDASIVPSVRSSVRFQQLDIVSLLADGPNRLADALVAPLADLTVCFGVLHHVPTFERRVALLQALIEKTAPEGTVCVSFWRFMSHEQLAKRTRALQPQALADCGLTAADLDPNDYLLGWNARPGVYRYCHHFSENEIDALVERLVPVATVVDRFASDGRSGNLNAYLVLRPLPSDR